MDKTLILSPEALELLGLSQKELSVYKALLRLGTAPLRRVAEEASLNRGTAYDALKRLIETGLASYVDAKTHRYFTAEEPRKIRSLATRRELELREASSMLDGLVRELEGTRGASGHRPAVRYYEGESGVREILEDVLGATERASSPMYRVYSSAGVRDLIAAAWPGFTRERIKRNIRVRAIAVGKGGTQAELSERKWLPSDESAPAYTFICAEKTAHVSVDGNQKLFGVVVEDAAIASTQALIFDALWSRLP